MEKKLMKNLKNGLNIYQILKSVPELLDVVHVEIVTKEGGSYASSPISIDEALSADGRYVIPPSDTIFEFKYPESDIVGTIE